MMDPTSSREETNTLPAPAVRAKDFSLNFLNSCRFSSQKNQWVSKCYKFWPGKETHADRLKYPSWPVPQYPLPAEGPIEIFGRLAREYIRPYCSLDKNTSFPFKSKGLRNPV